MNEQPSLSQKEIEIQKILDTQDMQNKISGISKLLQLPRPNKAKSLLSKVKGAGDLISYGERSYNLVNNGKINDLPLDLKGIAEEVVTRLSEWYSKEIKPIIETRNSISQYPSIGWEDYHTATGF